MEQDIQQGKEISIFEVLLALKEKWIVLLGVALMGAMIGWAITFYLITPQYEASVNMIVNTKTDVNVGVTTDNIDSAQNLVDTYAIIIKSNTVLNEVINWLKLDTTYEELYEQVTVVALNNTQVMKVSVRDDNPEQAKQIVEVITVIAPDIVVDAVEAGSCKVISQVIVGNKPISPNMIKNIFIASFISLCLCMGIIVIRMLLHDYVVDEVDVVKKLGISVLGIIPDMETN